MPTKHSSSNHIKNQIVNILSFFSGGLIGYAAWGHGLHYTLLSLFLFLAYLRIPRRLPLFLFVYSYYLAASRGLLVGTMHYYHGPGIAIAVWGSAALISSLAWIFVWYHHKIKRYLLLIVVLILISIPPIGYINWVNPLTTAGILFPGFSWYGFLLLLLIFISFDYLYDKSKKVFVGALLCSVVLLPIKPNAAKIDKRFAAISSHFNYATGHQDPRSKFYRLIKFVSMANHTDQSLVVLPENALGFFSELDMMVLDSLDANKTVFAGSNIFLSPSEYANVLIELKKGYYRIAYRQRVPVPISMWGNGTKAYLFQNPVVNLEGIRAGVLICYEQLIALTYAQTLWHHPQVLIGISNLWWAKGTSIKEIQQEMIQLWSSLFDVPYVFSVNQ